MHPLLPRGHVLTGCIQSQESHIHMCPQLEYNMFGLFVTHITHVSCLKGIRGGIGRLWIYSGNRLSYELHTYNRRLKGLSIKGLKVLKVALMARP